MNGTQADAKKPGHGSWRTSRAARLRLNYTSRQLLLGQREWKAWLRVFSNLTRLERSPVKALQLMLRFMSGHPRKRIDRR